MSLTTVAIETPIRFRDWEVRAILEGRKTQTRQPMDPRPKYGVELCPYSRTGWAITNDSDGCSCRPYPARFGHVGDRLWVREAWQKSGLGYGNRYPVGKVHYRATDDGQWKAYWGHWRPSTNMPRWASRITLEITDIRAQELEGISPEDAAAEGFDAPGPLLFDFYSYHADRIEHIHNPYVWAITFRRIEG